MVKFDALTVKYQDQTVIENLDFVFESGKFYGLTGASGIGKTTLLAVIAGLLKPTGGTVTTDHARIGYIFQDPRLFPWMTALENVECVCDNKERAKYYLDLLLPDSFDKYPSELSGGMKQRVSVARALAYDCDLLLLDEPFKGLDEQTKQFTVNTVLEFIKDRTAIMVSHETTELALCDTVYRMQVSPVTTLTEVKSGRSEIE